MVSICSGSDEKQPGHKHPPKANPAQVLVDRHRTLTLVLGWNRHVSLPPAEQTRRTAAQNFGKHDALETLKWTEGCGEEEAHLSNQRRLGYGRYQGIVFPRHA